MDYQVMKKACNDTFYLPARDEHGVVVGNHTKTKGFGLYRCAMTVAVVEEREVFGVQFVICFCFIGTSFSFLIYWLQYMLVFFAFTTAW